MIADILEASSAFLRKAREDDKRAARRRAYAIHSYVGGNGSGKSLAMVHDTIPTLRAGRKVLSTVRIVDFDDPHDCYGGEFCDDPKAHYQGESGERVHLAAHPGYVRFHSWDQLVDFTNGDVLMDEVTGVASSRESFSMPAQVVNMLMQLRRREVLLRWTAPNWARADKVIREVTQAVTSCRGTMPIDRAEGGRLWRDRRFFEWTTYDANDFDEFTAYRRDTAEPLMRQWFWRPGSIAEGAYDTFEPVSMIGTISETGRCMTCNGIRRPKPCKCEHD